ncbi:hypothetical protein BpHYR1_023614 [Brachionus plicatilis]|uniref:Uncharacterized protein n=1 Tax=Brachionus plicatilis TaxID=10195 RepID=A0A3M7SRH4_BRAPC|nr:hypothetical protein BpHYR1_023614 [Brachionus plicatilis]
MFYKLKQLIHPLYHHLKSSRMFSEFGTFIAELCTISILVIQSWYGFKQKMTDLVSKSLFTDRIMVAGDI